MAYSYLRYRLAGAERVIIFGAGTHTQQLLALDSDGFLRGRIEAIIDNGAQMRATEVAGYSVFPLSEIHRWPTLSVVLSHAEFESGMRRDLLTLGISNQRLVPIYSDDGYAVRLEMNGYNQIPVGKWRFDDRPRILRVNVRPTAIVDSEAWSLLENQFDVIHATLCRGGMLQYKGSILDCRQSLRLWLELVETLRPDIVYVHDQFTTCNIVASLTKLIFPECTVVVEFYDWLRLYLAEPNLMCTDWYWSESELAMAIAAESECLPWYDGVVSKEEPTAVSCVAPNTYCFLPYVAKSMMRRGRDHWDKGKPRLVWAGSIISSFTSPVLFGDNRLLQIFERLAAQEFPIQIITGHNSVAAFSEALPEYASLVDLHHGIKFVEGMKRVDSIDWMSQHSDIGLLLAGDASEARRIGMATTFASKLMTYLAAGLPVIVSAEFEYCAELVREWGVGFVISRSEIDCLDSVLLSVPYEFLKFNIYTWQQRNSLDQHVEGFASYLIDCSQSADGVPLSRAARFSAM